MADMKVANMRTLEEVIHIRSQEMETKYHWRDLSILLWELSQTPIIYHNSGLVVLLFVTCFVITL